MHQLHRITARIVLVLALAPFAVHAAESSPVGPFSDARGFFGFGQIQLSDGRQLYERICRGCHMADGRGATGAGAYPSLVENPRLTAKAWPAYVVINGIAAMPSMGIFMTDEQVAAVVNYVRTAFGNRATDTLTVSEVASMRASATAKP